MNVCKLLGILAAATIMAGAHAKTPAQLGEACVDQIKEQMLEKENAYLTAEYGVTIREPEILGWGSQKEDGTYSFRGWITDLTDGRNVDYTATKISKQDAATCNIDVKRDTASACRYTSDGDGEFLERSGAKFVREVTLKPTTKLSAIEFVQIASFLNAEDDNVAKAIENTDDGEITKRVVEFKNGVRADYYKAYGGDNPYGIFYREKTTEVIGDNSDAFICISYAVEK